MQRSVDVMSAQQQAYHFVMQWLVDLPVGTRYEHMNYMAMQRVGTEYLAVSVVAWSSSRRAVFDVAVRLFLRHSRCLVRDVEESCEVEERRIHRAISQTGLAVDFRQPIENVVRVLAHEYRLERSISAWAMHGHSGQRFSRQAAVQLYGILRQTMQPDENSASEED